MSNPQLDMEQLEQAHAILHSVRAQLDEASGGDPKLRFALSRKVQKELSYDERSKPAHRNKIKRERRIEQANLCPICDLELPEKYAVLDRFEAWKGYTFENTQLIHADCDFKQQQSKGYK